MMQTSITPIVVLYKASHPIHPSKVGGILCAARV